MEPHKLRFVRCPKCYQLLVEYPSIPVYKCGGCSTVLRAKNRALPAVQARSESDVQNSFPSSLKGSPQDSKSICFEEHKTASSVDQPREAPADGIISSPVNNANSCEDAIEERPVSVAENVAPAQHQKEETCSFIDKNTKTPGVTIKDMHEKGTEADFGSKLIGEVENLDTSENANGGKMDKVDMSVMRTLDKKTELVQREERLHTHEGIHAESHEALIEELERSLSFSSDDEYFSDEAETSGLSDALRHQMGSRRFMFGGQMNDSSRNDPHGRLIEELEMSFSDVEEPMEEHAVGTDRINGNKHDKHLQTLDAESANPCEESIPSLQSEKTSHQGNKPFGNGSERNEDIGDDNNSANYVHENEHDKHPQILCPNSAHPCEESIPPPNNGHLESEQTIQENRLIDNDSQWMEDIEGDNITANDAHGNEHVVVVNEISEEGLHEKKHDKDLQPANAEVVYPCERSASSIDHSNMKFNQTIQPNGLRADGTQENKQGCMDNGNMTNYIHGNKNVLRTNEDVVEKVHGNEDVAFDHTGENEKSHVEDDSPANYVHGEENDAVADEHIAEEVDKNEQDKDQQSQDAEFAEKVHGNEVAFDRTGENDENHVEDDNPPNYVHGEENIAVADEHIAERVDKNEQDNDQQSQEAEFAEKVHGNEEVAFDHSGDNDENHVEDDNPVNYVHGEENIAVADEHIAENIDKNEQDKDRQSQEAQFAEKVHGNEEVAFDRTGENDENHVEDDNPANYVHGEESVAVADEHIVEKVDKNEQDKDQQSQEAEFSNTKHVKSEVIFKQEDLISDSSKQKEEYGMGDDNPTNSIQEDSTTVASFSRWSNKRTQCKLSSFNKNKEEASYKYRASQLRQGLSLDAKDFKSIQSFIESQMDGTSSSLSSGSPYQGDLVPGRSNKFNNIVRHERLKKMDELRDQLSRLSSQKGMEEKYQRRGLEYQQQSDSYDVEQHLQSADVDSVSNSCTLESYYGYERPPRYQPPNRFSPTHTYPHCDFGHAQARIPYNHDVWEFNSYYQSSYTESTVLDQDSMLSSYKEPKRVVRKHILRPLSGASPFSICSGCFNLIQMPSDMYISRAKVGKMQCGRCSKVIVLSFPAAYHAEGKISVDVLQQYNKPAGSSIAKNKDATSHSSEHLRGPVSINEEYEASFRRSFSTKAGASLAATQSAKKVSDTALHRLMGYDSASQLLRHSRALDDGYDSFESMVPVSRRVSRRKNM